MRVLKKGLQGADVKRWQNFLAGQGYRYVIADGDFGPKTHKATNEFQQANDLNADGIVGNQTLIVAMQLGFSVAEDKDDLSKKGPNWPAKPDFKSLNLTVRQTLFGKYDYKTVGTEGDISIVGDWEEKNIVRVQIPELIGIKGLHTNGNVRVHRLVTDQLLGMWSAWKKKNLLKYVLTYEGAYCPRLVRGGTTLSPHAFGTAFYLNYEWNRLGVQPALVGEEGSVRALVPIANEYGFYWGGHFTRLDGMHFEVAKLIT
jgi:hypothetical protein